MSHRKSSTGRSARNATLICMVEPDLRALVEREAARRDISISSTIRAILKAQLLGRSGTSSRVAGA